MQAFTERLAAILGSPTPFLFLDTFEEERAASVLRQVAGSVQRTVAEWHADVGGAERGLDQAFAGLGAERRVLHVFWDAHPYLDAPRRVRALRSAAGRLMASESVAVFVSPRASAPADLARDAVTLALPLPPRAELEAIARRAVPAGAPVDPARLATAAVGLTAREALRAFRQAAAIRATDDRAQAAWEAAVVAEKKRLVATASALEFFEISSDLDDVGGLDELKRWVHERRLAFSDDARRFGLPLPRGLLLLGVQGCGKSLAAKSLAAFWGLPLLRLDVGALFNGDVPPEPALRAATQAAEAMSPCVLWVDEIEKGFPAGDSDTARLLGSLLTWLQEKQHPVFFVATANSVDTLPPELLRRGRFDELFFVDLPDAEGRRQVLNIHLERRRRDPAAFDTAELARITANFSGAELEQLVVAALYTAFGAGRELTQSDLVDAARALVPLFTLREVEIKALRTWARDRARPAGTDRSLLDLFGGNQTTPR